MQRLAPLLVVASALCVGPAGCERPPSRDRVEPAATAGAVADGNAEAEAEGPCAAYAEAICDKAGPESSACASVRDTSTLLPAEACELAMKDLEGAYTKLAARAGVCDGLWDRLCGDIGEKTETCTMIRARGGDFDVADCKAMLDEYDQVLAEVRGIEARNAPLSPELMARLAGEGAPAFGPVDAPVTVVAFSDFQCPYCARGAAAIDELKAAYPDKVRVVFRQFPLSFHADAHLAAQAALAAHAQGKFWAFHDRLFAAQEALGRGALEGHAAELGLDMTAFRAALDDGRYAAAVDADLALGGEAFVDGTPTMFLNGERVPNPTDAGALGQQVAATLAAQGG